MSDLRTRLASVPDPTLDRRPEIERAIAHSVEYLGSDAAQRSLDQDTYWPKWNSPWWHMLLLYELDEVQGIPERAVAKMIEGLNALRVKIFPIHQHEFPEGADPHRDVSCHCAIGSIHQVLSACGVSVDHAVPWIPPWVVSYQMADGGLNCDSDAYLRTDECPSSMVATVPLFEALLRRREWTPEERDFVERAAGFLIDRRLTEGSRSTHNAEEREAAPAWLDPCFPRFYFYDVLRGLAALVRWAELGAGSLPLDAVRGVIEHLVASFPDGMIRPRRRAHAGKGTLAQHEGAWVREPASTFPLLEAASVLGEPSEALTRQWSVTRRALIGLIDDGRLAA
ncbi:MAG TPA: hypothetical protein VHR17_10855 [Thermoanaerobaculia bacterium]|jgi:hypothetical protein|nr:hypothetical protein [Thermoanaerobaculia bacterium]